jgi:hypothetical protein
VYGLRHFVLCLIHKTSVRNEASDPRSFVCVC